VVQLVEQREIGTEWQFWITPAPGSGKATKDSPQVWRIADMPELENCA
jgi:hypothetical protein